MAKGKGKSGGEYVMKSKVKEAISKAGFRSSGDVFDAVNATVDWYLKEAVARAKANGRQTVRGYDVCALS
jgi:histone H3/H4